MIMEKNFKHLSDSRDIELKVTHEYNSDKSFPSMRVFGKIKTRFYFTVPLLDSEGKHFSKLLLQSLRINNMVFAFWELSLHGLDHNSLEQEKIDSVNIGEINLEGISRDTNYHDFINKWQRDMLEYHYVYERKIRGLYLVDEKLPRPFFNLN